MPLTQTRQPILSGVGSADNAPQRCRKRPTKWIKQRLLEEQSGHCFSCQALLAAGLEYDHVIALGLGGSNAADNWAALCPACHKIKTRQDLRMIAKAKRRRRYQETGRSRAPSNYFLGSRGFDKTMLKRMNGRVEVRCNCRECQQAECCCKSRN